MNVDLKNLSQVGGVQPEIGKAKAKPEALSKGPSFAETLQTLKEPTAPQANLGALAPQMAEGVKFSNHAVERMMSRGIRFSPEDMGKLNEAVARAGSKGSKDTLVLMNDSALIVSVKNKTVVTVMDKTALKDNVFTNIDSTVVI